MGTSDITFHVMIDGAYANVPHSTERASNYINLPNSHYEPHIGQRALEDQLETLVAMERYGYDGVMVSEQHNGPIGLWGNPMIAGTWLAARTNRIKIVVNGPILNRYQNPVALAEEVASLDTLSRGRLVLGLPMGHGMQYHSMGVINPATARRRYREAHDLFIKALTHEGPFSWNGEFFNVPYVNLWPRPMRKPEIMIPGGGSVETLELVAKHRYGYQPVLSPRATILKTLERLRELCRAEGYEPAPSQFAQYMSIHVAETDEQARREVERHELWSYQNFFRSPQHDNFPPGYVSAKSMRGILSAGGYRSTPLDQMSLDEIEANHWCIYGSPETVAEKLRASLDESGAGTVVLAGNFGTKPRWLAEKSLGLFAEQVLPKFKSEIPSDGLHGYSSRAQFGTMRSEDLIEPTVILGGEKVTVPGPTGAGAA